MSTHFTAWVHDVLAIEGGEVDHPDDPGGHTIHGITAATARRHGLTLPITTGQAIKIYRKDYWNRIKGDDLAAVLPSLAWRVADAQVNAGRGAVWLQRSLNALNLREKLYSDLKVDGAIGRKTIAALHAYAKVRDPDVLRRAVMCLQGQHYIALSEADPKFETFTYGWIKQRIF